MSTTRIRIHSAIATFALSAVAIAAWSPQAAAATSPQDPVGQLTSTAPAEEHDGVDAAELEATRQTVVQVYDVADPLRAIGLRPCGGGSE